MTRGPGHLEDRDALLAVAAREFVARDRAVTVSQVAVRRVCRDAAHVRISPSLLATSAHSQLVTAATMKGLAAWRTSSRPNGVSVAPM